jgi:CRP-like cAMP-binding protein
MTKTKSTKTPTTLRELFEACTHDVCQWRAGELVLLQGERADAVYLVLEGALQLWRAREDRSELVAVARPGELVAEIALVAPGAATETVRAQSVTRALRVDHEALTALWKSQPRLARELHAHALFGLIERLRNTNCERAAAWSSQKGGTSWTRLAA